ncbi:MAG: hypothetical protein JNL32_08920 [Candidatus Kapabacteria bacterium]|nr:hypothetical protein [Candidatus Kapabacteria bacterium]
MTQTDYDKAVLLNIKARERDNLVAMLVANTYTSAVISIAGSDSLSGTAVSGVAEGVSMYADIRTALTNRKNTLDSEIALLITDLGGGIVP